MPATYPSIGPPHQTSNCGLSFSACKRASASDTRNGSGSITIVAAAGDVYVEDGSGKIDIRSVGGSVTVDDGSGDIEIDDVEQDLVIEEEGSGSLRYTNVRGSVQQND